MPENLKRLGKFDRVTLASLVLFALLLPFSKAAISFFSIWLPLLLVARRNYTHTLQSLRSTPIFFLFGLFFTYFFLTILWSTNFAAGLDQIRKYSYIFILIPVLYCLMRRDWIVYIYAALMFSLSVSAALSLGHYFEWWSIKGAPSLNSSPWMNSIHYSVFMAILSIFSCYMLFFVKTDKRLKLLFLFVLVLGIGALLLSTGRTGQLGFVVALLVLCFLKYKDNLKYLILAMSSLVVLMAGAYLLVSPFQKRVEQGVGDLKVLHQKGDFNTSWGLRVGFWVVGYEIFKESPFFGAGIGDYMVAARKVLDEQDLVNKRAKNFLSTSHFHNQYLMFLVQGGLVALGLFLMLLYRLFVLPVENKEAKDMGILFLTVYCAGSLAEPLLLLNFPRTLFIFLVALYMSQFTFRIDGCENRPC